MEERSDGILLRPAATVAPMLSWEETARQMAESDEDWTEWDSTVADGLDELPWHDAVARRNAKADRKQVAESNRKYAAKPRRRK